MTLYMIGLGLSGKDSISLKALNALKKSSKIYLEEYTSLLPHSIEELEELIGKKVTALNREDVEKTPEEIFEEATEKNASFIVIGDVFSATTHLDLWMRAKDRKLDVKIINNASILNAVGNVGLDLYKYGRTTSIVFKEGEWIAETPYNAIRDNKSIGLHTLCLLDIKTAEPSKENLKKNHYEPEEPRYMSIKDALKILLELEEKKNEKIITRNTIVVGVARIGETSEIIKSGTVKELLEYDFGKPLHSLIIPGKLNHVEEEALNYHK